MPGGDVGAAIIPLAMFLAYLLDALAGDPPRLPHPVRLLGKTVELLERAARGLFSAPFLLKISGAALVLLLAGGSSVVAALLLQAASRLHGGAEFVLTFVLLFSFLAGGDLKHHVQRVAASLDAGNLEQARAGTGMLVSRETSGLGEEGVARSSLESLFENTADGLVAPLFYAALGGVPLAVLYKAVNTADSMLGYRTTAYIHLGWAAARADDVLSFIPSRLTALLFVAAGFLRGTARRGWSVLIADRCKHESPNSAWPEAAAAGVLGVRLGGEDYYGSELKCRPVINAAGRRPRLKELQEGIALFNITGWMALALLLIFSYAWNAWGVMPW